MIVRKDEFARRRRQLMRMIGKGGIAILPAATEKQRNSDVHYHYRPDSDFHYLTGFDEPEAVAVLVPGRAQAEYILFVRDRDPTRETWDGKRAGPDGATRDYGADDAFPIGDIDDILPGLIEQCARVYHTMGVHPEFDQHVIGWVNTLRGQAKLGMHTPQDFVALDHLLHDMRLYKSRTELAVMRRAAQISVAAHIRAMKTTRPGVHEYAVMAELLHEFHRNDADIAYHPIVGGGANACTLHYHANDARTAGRRPAADRRGLRVPLLRLGHHADVPGQWPLHGRAAGDLRGRARRAAGGVRSHPPGQPLERAPRRGRARHHAGTRPGRAAEGPGARR